MQAVIGSWKRHAGAHWHLLGPWLEAYRLP